MARNDRFHALALATLLTLPLGAVACSESGSPTEPVAPSLETSSSTASVVTSTADESRNGGRAEDTASNRRGRGGRQGAEDDNQNNRRNRGRGRGGDDNPTPNPNPNPNPAPRGQEFEARVTAVGAGSLTLANGITVVVNGSTQWNARGDLFSLADVASSLAAGRNPRVEGRGQRQANGSIVAATIKGEDGR